MAENNKHKTLAKKRLDLIRKAKEQVQKEQSKKRYMERPDRYDETEEGVDQEPIPVNIRNTNLEMRVFLEMFGMSPAHVSQRLQTVNFMKIAQFLITINTNKTRDDIMEIPAVISRGGITAFDQDLIREASEFLTSKLNYIPKTPKHHIKIDYFTHQHTFEYSMMCIPEDPVVKDSSWEEGPNKRRHHIHIVVGFKYFPVLQGYFHVDVERLRNTITNYLTLYYDWILNERLYIYSRYIKDTSESLNAYINKQKTIDATKTLVAITLQKINEYKKTIQDRQEQKNDENVGMALEEDE